MTLDDLIRQFRVRSKDRVAPYLTETRDVEDWLNEAEEEACIRGRLIRDVVTADVVQIALTPGTWQYELHPAVYELIDLAIHPDGTADPYRWRGLKLVTREWLDNNVRDWRERTDAHWGFHQYVVQDDRRLQVVGRIDPGDVLHIEAYRLPLVKIEESDTQEPEIARVHHRRLIDWALYQAFSVPDSDLFDPVRAQQALKDFEDYFGLRPDSDLRRTTRTDEVQHNYLML